MPNGLDAELTSLTYDGEDVQRADLSIHLDIVHGLDETAGVRGTDTVIPAAVGRVPRNRVWDALDIELAGWVQGNPNMTTEADSLSSWRNRVDFLQALFDPTRDPATLQGTAWDGSTRSIACRPTSAGMVWGDTDVFGVRKVSIALTAVEEWTNTGGGS